MVAKARGSGHSNQIREFRITADGIEFADVYAGIGGVLTGVARQEQEAVDEAERRRVEYMIEAKRAEIARRAAELDAETNRLRAAVEQAQIELTQLEVNRTSARNSEKLRRSTRSSDRGQQEVVRG